MSLEIRLEEPDDRDVVLEVERLAFRSEEEPAIVETIAGEEGSFVMVAVEDEEVVGHVQFSRAWVGDTAVVALGPIGVHPRCQGRGIGSALIRAGCTEAEARGERAVILIGSPEFYPRLGFEPALRHGLRNPFAGVDEGDFVIAEKDFMLRDLRRDLSEEPTPLSGAVRWHRAFGQADG